MAKDKEKVVKVTEKWEEHLKRLEASIEFMRSRVKNDIAYGVVHILKPNRTKLDFHQNPPPIQASGGHLYSHFKVELYDSGKDKKGGGETAHVARAKLGQQHHFTFAWQWPDSPDLSPLTDFYKCIRKFPEILKWIPPSQLRGVQFTSPRGLHPDQENLVIWTQFLMWVFKMSGEASACHYQVVCEYADSVKGLRNGIGQWENHETVPDFDPVELVAWKAQSKSFLEDWQQQFQNSKKKLPAVMCASLSKPLFYASSLAIRHFLNELVHRRAQRVNRRRKTLGLNKTDLGTSEYYVLGILYEHHKCSADKPSSKAITQREIANQAKLSQATVSRSFERIIQMIVKDVPKKNDEKISAMKSYKKLCEEGLIVGILKKLVNGEEKVSSFGVTYDDNRHGNVDSIVDDIGEEDEYSG